MITLPERTFRLTGGVAPYTYTIFTGSTCLTTLNPSGISEDGLISILQEASDESCLTGTTTTLDAEDANGCPFRYTFLPNNPCDSFSITSLTENQDYQFTVTVDSTLTSQFTYNWQFSDVLFTEISSVDNGYSSTLTLQPNEGVSFPSMTDITVIVTDSFGCEEIANYTYGICTPRAQDLNLNAYCVEGGTYYQSGIALLPDPVGCDNWESDFSTFVIANRMPSGFNFIRNNDYTLAVEVATSVSPGTYTFLYTVSNTEGVDALNGIITVIVHPCTGFPTVSIPNVTYQVDCESNIGDYVDIPIEVVTSNASVVVDWNTFNIVTPPSPSSGDITVIFDNGGNAFLHYRIDTMTGADVVRWSVCAEDGYCAETTTYTVLLECPAAPTAVDDLDCVICNQAVTIPVLDNDLTTGVGLDVTSIQVVSLPTLGTAVPDNLGNIIYTPNAGPQTGTDTFTYIVANTNGVYSEEATVTVNLICAGSGTTTVTCN